MLPEVAFLLRACIQSFHGFIYVPFSIDKHDKRGFLFKTRARLFNAPGNHVMTISFVSGSLFSE